MGEKRENILIVSFSLHRWSRSINCHCESGCCNISSIELEPRHSRLIHSDWGSIRVGLTGRSYCVGWVTTSGVSDVSVASRSAFLIGVFRISQSIISCRQTKSVWGL